MTLSTAEHPFAEFIKILGKGKKGARALTQDEAYRAMRLILADQVLPIQLGAFLMLMRVKEETAEELAGFVQAVRETLPSVPVGLAVDLDWSSYAGKRRHLPWFLLSTLLLADNGITVFMHGASGHTQGRLYTENVLPILGLRAAESIADAQQQLQQQRFSYLSLQHICPSLFDIINLKPVMGLRSPVHTLVRLINPLQATATLQGIFHPSYRQVHQQAALLLGQQHMAVLKGEGGETERNPDSDCLVQRVDQGVLYDEHWPALFARRHMKPESLDPALLLQLWRGQWHDEYAQASVTSTVAVALKLLGKADSMDAAQALAEQYWQARDRHRF
jgi:anthranilate phosphoribosyltransferase